MSAEEQVRVLDCGCREDDATGLPIEKCKRHYPGPWIFTFGFGHVHPQTGESLSGCFVRVPGDINESRQRMLAVFGQKWAFQYFDEESAGVQKFGLREIPFPEPPAQDTRETDEAILLGGLGDA